MTLLEFVGCILKGLTIDRPTWSITYKDFLFYDTQTGDLWSAGPTQWDLIQGAAKAEILQNKVIDASTNTFTKVITDPFATSKRQGWITPAITSTGSVKGALKGWVPNGTYSYIYADTTYGYISRFSSSIVESIGYFSTTTPFLTRREFAAYLKITTKVSTTSNSRLYMGFNSVAIPSNNDAPIGTTDNGIVMGFNTANANFAIFRNDGVNPPATLLSFGVAKDTNWHTFEMTMSDTNIICKLDGANTQTLSTDIPALTTDIIGFIQFQNATATAKSFDIARAYFESDIA